MVSQHEGSGLGVGVIAVCVRGGVQRGVSKLAAERRYTLGAGCEWGPSSTVAGVAGGHVQSLGCAATSLRVTASEAECTMGTAGRRQGIRQGPCRMPVTTQAVMIYQW